ncbi:MAG: FHA domain-containing protein [Bdellovibrionota bacterium]
MYKLTVVAGPNRGSSYAIREGEISIGRQSGNDVVLPSSKVSKRHCILVVNNEEVIVKDNGSSNGTLVNGVPTKETKIGIGDKVSIGDFVLELRKASGTGRQIVPAMAGLGNVVHFPAQDMDTSQRSQSMNYSQPMPTDLKGKLIWVFDKRIMPVFYRMNQRYEWKQMGLIAIFAFVLANLFFTVDPLLESGRQSIIKEAKRRATFMASQIAEKNTPFLAARAETKTEIGSIENADGVKVAVLTDLDSRIIAPSAKMNQHFALGNEARFAVKMAERFRRGFETGAATEIDSSTVVAVEPVKIFNAATGQNIVAAMAVVAMDTSISTLGTGEIGMIYSQSIIITGLLGLLVFAIMYKLTLRPFSILNEEMDKVLRGDKTQVTKDFKFNELDGLVDLINSALQRVPKSGQDGSIGGSGGLENLAQASEDYLGPAGMIGNIGNALKFGLVLCDSDKKIIYLNQLFEEISGIRATTALGNDFVSIARDQSLGMFTADLFERVAVGSEGLTEDYDFGGISYKVYVATFGSMGSLPKGYLLVAVKAEENG